MLASWHLKQAFNIYDYYSKKQKINNFKIDKYRKL